MKLNVDLSPLALAAIAAVTTVAVPTAAQAAKPTPGSYVTGDFHNHTTCSDGSISLQKLVSKATAVWGLDWFVQAGHGGSGNRNCTLVEDPALDTPAYPYDASKGPQTTWVNSGVTVKGDVNGTGASRNMWRWQAIQEFSYPLMEYLSAYKNKPLFMGIETVSPGHEHTSATVIGDQIPKELDGRPLPSSPGYAALGNATALAKWEYCFDRADADTSRGNFAAGSKLGNNWDCSVKGSPNAADPNWNATARKLMPVAGVGTGIAGHNKSVEAVKWMAQKHAKDSYFVPAHLERAGPFNPDGNNGFNIEDLRDFNNVSSNIAFGFETQPGHGAANNRGEYSPRRNNFGGVLVDSVGGTTYGGTGVYGAQIGGVWDALLGEGRRFWFFASSDWHNRGLFGADDLRSTQDFQPGEYQRNFTMVRHGADKIRPQMVVDGLRSGNGFAASGQLIDRLVFVACSGGGKLAEAKVQTLAAKYAAQGGDLNKNGCAVMGQKLVVPAGSDIVVGVALRDPQGNNNAPYSFDNPSLLQIGMHQPMNQPVLDHVDLIGGKVTGFRTPGASDYAGEWPRNTAWLGLDGSVADLSAVPAAAKNTSTAVLKTFSAAAKTWKTKVSQLDGTTYTTMAYTIPNATASQYVRLRGTNLPASLPYETDPNGNPLPDLFTNGSNTDLLKIACTAVGTNVPETGTPWTSGVIDGCPKHLAIASGTSPIAGQKAVSYDVAAWADLWFYSNPIYVEVQGSTLVAGVK